ncbi:hypothetical protein [Nocardioides sp. Kera G14]|uniref:hypothetical protein n=1 Tax=Nocardioides sp. Kera G14 TaxID=2884264 RepID=UPI001D10A121|nr:hypothetical protein [Nocardioides sp. Kera G14]UDY22370.1 hypothetical protein LH076_09785 [Nocardioides sp. Kera G14]
MAERLVLHLGAMKTGTTYLQSMIRQNREVLHAAGLRDARTLGRPAGAVSKLLARPRTAEAVRPWHALITAVRAAPEPTVVLSTEFLSLARPHQIAALLAPTDGLVVDVVLVARDQTGAIPSQWQTYCRNYGDDSWPTYLARIDPARAGDPESRAWRSYYRAQELDRIVGDWSGHDGVSQMDLITLPHTRRESLPLWRTFAAIARADVPVTEPGGRVNPSVGHASAQMLLDLGRHWRRAGHRIQVVKPAMRHLIAETLAPRRAMEGPPQLDRAAWSFAQRRNQAVREAVGDAVASSRLTVHGRLDDLTSPASAGPLPSEASNPEAIHVQAAARALWQEVRRRAGLTTATPPLTYPDTLRDIVDLVPRTASWPTEDARAQEECQV